VFVYNRAIAYAKSTVCQTNLRALETAIDLHTLETDALPASLGQLKLEHIEKGYAREMEDKGWLKKLSFFLIKMNSSREAYAQFLTPENLKTYGGSEAVFHDPADHNGGASYGINGNLAGKDLSKIDKDELLIADSDHYVFTSPEQLAGRHRGKAFVITKRGALLELNNEGEGDDKKGKKDKKDKKNKKAQNDSVIAICHKPGTGQERTILIPESASLGHLAHGDKPGDCTGGS
jgi:hypothetical protein